MVLKGFQPSNDDELLDEQDPGQSAYEDNEYPDIAGCLLFQSAIRGRYRDRTGCEEKQPTFQALIASKQRTTKTLQVVVREQLGPQLGNKAMLE